MKLKEMIIPLDFIQNTIRTIYKNDRWFSYDSMLRTCSEVENIMTSIGLQEVRTIHYPADGKTAHGGWVMPCAWKPENARLEVILPDGSVKEICSYQDCPCSLILYSTACDVTGKVVMYSPDADVRGKFVLSGDHFFDILEGMELFDQGALGLLSEKLLGGYYGKEGYEHLNDSCQWCNYMLPYWKTDGAKAGFSLTPNQSAYLRQLLEEYGEVTLHAVVDAQLTDGTIPLVTGFLPGETEEEIVITGHLFEQGADDNASGCAMALAMVKELAKQKRKRGVRLLFTHEIKSLQAYLNTTPRLPKIVAGIDIDMVSATASDNVLIGDSIPVFPNYTPALLKHWMEQYGYKAVINANTAWDTQFADPEYKVPMTFFDAYDVPDYHKSSDTLETVRPEILQKSYKVLWTYLETLVNAGKDTARKLAEYVYEYEKERAETLKAPSADPAVRPATPEFARKSARQRLDSILTLVDEKEQEEVRTSLQPYYQKTDALFHFPDPCPCRPELSDVQRKKMEKLYPVKQFHGYFSFEQYLMEREHYPEIKHLFCGWSVPGWLDYALMWSDGSRSSTEIWDLLTQSGKKADPEILCKVLDFLAEKAYITLERR